MSKKLAAATALVVLCSCTTTDIAPVTDLAHYGPDEANAWTASVPPVVERYGDASPKQVGELRLPRGKGPFPVTMLVHGGWWSGMGSPRNMSPLADWLATNGVATWNISYRELGSDGGWPATFEDWASGLAALNSLAERHPLDLERITVIGHSAGTPAAVWLATGGRGDGILERNLPDVRASVLLDGPAELGSLVGVDEMICGGPVITRLMGGTPSEVPARYDMVDPRKNRLKIDSMLIADAALPDPSPEVVAALRASGVDTEVIALDQNEHFDLLKPGTADFAKIAPALLRITRAR